MNNIRNLPMEAPLLWPRVTRWLHYLVSFWPLIAMKMSLIAYKIYPNNLKILPNTKWTLSKWPKFCDGVPKWQKFRQIWSHCCDPFPLVFMHRFLFIVWKKKSVINSFRYHYGWVNEISPLNSISWPLFSLFSSFL